MDEHDVLEGKTLPGLARAMHWLTVMSLILACGCATYGKIEDPLGSNAAPVSAKIDVSAAAARQVELEAAAQETHTRLSELHAKAGWQERGYFNGSEHDAIEWLFFRYVHNHRAFWAEIDRLGGVELALTTEADRPGAHLLVLHAGLALAEASAFLVTEFQEDPIAVAKLNESFYRSEIQAGSYDLIALAATNAKRREALTRAWALHETEMADPKGSAVAAVALDDPELASVLASLAPLRVRVETQLKGVDAGHDRVLTDLDHGLAADASRASGRSFDSVAYKTRSLVFKDVSRIKNPTAHLIQFSPAQKRELHGMLRPGDVILSYTAGYVSDVFIPGTFKHGITYVGVEEERKEAGLTSASLPIQDRSRAAGFASNITKDRMPDGSRADLIEAVAEGVKFSNLDTILDTHVNRLLVLRPLIEDAERTAFLAGVFAYLGDSYDFRFDFADASRQVCTEVIYRALDGKGGIAFTLVPRGGHPTLSADDVALFHLLKPGHFEVLAFAGEDPDRDDHAARLWVGDAAERRLSRQMQSD